MDKNLNYFIESFDELLEKYRDKFIVIKDCSVVAAYDSLDEACAESEKTEDPDTYIIQYCVPEAMVPDAWRAWSHKSGITFAEASI